MPFLTYLLRQLWFYRAEITFVIQALSRLRKSAREWTIDYLKQRFRRKLAGQIVIVFIQTTFLASAYGLNSDFPSLKSRLLASVILWVITLYNVTHLCFSTIPEMREVYRALKGKVGFTLKYILGISIATELMELNIIFLVLCWCLAFSSRSMMARTFRYVQPWKELSSSLAHHPRTKRSHEILK